ncbi:gamma-glutamyl-gamma-aminobutyrate hydrolase family protein [Nocardioides yefusunii]|uniref:Gamma-glutamyl-gamma-aminobutyrate hydrolase family protein n=1 Tax=Nocardioides yefusunii TaxID=2500546 RepID=A0ABW1QS50_9ACTN|nr:gamma-glutamyl-gamma-aminobutyrate hydrolase family protein [Nocardioides yefusunii]
MTHPHVLVLHLRTARPHDPGFQVELDALNDATLAVLDGLGATAELLATSEVGSDVVDAAYARADAVVVMGGEDVHPRFYGGAASYPEQGHHEEVSDAVQLDVVRRCFADATPLLGICRGHQLLNVAAGGTLVQHLPTTHLHRAGGVDPFARTEVTVHDADLATAVEAGRAVRCTHHQAVDRLGAGLRVAATAPDGVVEAVVGVDLPVTGVQWHPEHPAEADVALRRLLTRTLAQAGASAQVGVSAAR